MEDKLERSFAYALEKLQKSAIRLTPFQKCALRELLTGRDTFVGLPTGHGKSILFECFPHCWKYLQTVDISERRVSVIVISPLIELMKTQVADLRGRYQTAVRVSSDITKEEESSLRQGTITYVFSSPESILEGRWRSLLRTDDFINSVRAVFVDEAHCVDSWGTGVKPFRKKYGEISSLHSFLPSNIPFAALTATASNATRTKICSILCMINPAIVTTSPSRSNLRYSVVQQPEEIAERFRWLVDELRIHKQCTLKTIIFCQSIDACATLYQFFDFSLRKSGYVPEGMIDIRNALFGMYHAKITDEEKLVLTKSFMDPSGVCRVLFCTVAFGMGINISNIRRVIHNGPAKEVDEYIQETGRGGRDGNLCEVALYVFKGCTRGKVCQEMKAYCKNRSNCRRKVLMSGFSGDTQYPPKQHLCCDICALNCLCNCTCGYCSCNQEMRNVPCPTCCSCEKKCTFISESTIVTSSTHYVHADSQYYEHNSTSDNESDSDF